MKYALLIHPGDGRAEFDRLDPEAKQEIVREFLAIADEPGSKAATSSIRRIQPRLFRCGAAAP